MGKAERNPKLPYIPYNVKKITRSNSLSVRDQSQIFHLMYPERYHLSKFPKYNKRLEITSNNRKPTKGRYWKIQLINKQYTDEKKTKYKISKRSKRVLHKQVKF